MSITVTIGGVAKSPLVHSLSLTLGLQAQATCEMEFLAQDGWIPAVGAAVEVRSSGTLIYLGSVESVPRQVIVDSKVRISVSCVDITQITGRRVCGMKTYVGKNAGYIFNRIIAGDLLGENISTTYVSDSAGPVIPTFETKYETVNDRLNTLAETAGMVWRLTWDREARLHLATAYDAGFQIDASTSLVQNLKIEGDRSNYANRVIVTLPQGTVPGKVDTYTSAGRAGDENDPGQAVDGVQYVFQTSHRMVDAPVITWTGYLMTVGEEGIDTGKDCYWTRGSTEWRVDSTIHVPPAATDTMVVTYTAVTETQIVSQNDAEVTARATAEGGTGVYAIHKEIAEEISTADAQAYADNLVAALSQISYTATFETDTHMNPLCAGTEPGQRIYIDRTGYGVSGWFLIRRVTISDLKLAQGTYLRYRIEASNGPGAGDALTWFRQLLGQGGPSIGLSAGGIVPPEAPGVPGAATAPTQPTLANWSVGSITISADASKNYYVGITLSEIGAPPGDADMLQFWLYRGGSRPTDPGLWENVLDLTAAGSQTIYERYVWPGDWVICATASRSDWRQAPDDTTPLRVVTISAPSTVTPPSDFVAELQTRTNDGLREFRYEFRFTAPGVSDQNYRLARLSVAWVNVTDGSWATGVSKWEHVADFDAHDASICYISGDSSSAWVSCIPPSGSVAGRRRWRLDFVNWNDEPLLSTFDGTSLTGTQLTPREPYADGFDASFVKAATVKNMAMVDASATPPALLRMHPYSTVQPFSVYQGQPNQAGLTQWSALAAWTAETETSERCKVYFAWAPADGSWNPTDSARSLGGFRISQSAVSLPPQNYTGAATNAVLFVFIESRDGKLAQCATLHFVIPAGPTGELDLSATKPGTANLIGDLTLSRGAEAGQVSLTFGAFKAAKTTLGVQNMVLVDGSGITIAQGSAGGNLIANAAGIIISKVTSGVTSKTEVNATGVQISYGTTGGVTTVDSTGVSIGQGAYSVKATAAGITIKQTSGATMTLDADGIVVQKGASAVSVLAGGVTIVNGILNSPSITVTGSLFTTVINATDGFKATFTGGAYAGQIVKIQADGVVIEKSSWQGLRLSAPAASTGGKIDLVIDDVTPGMAIIADSSSNRITSARSSSYLDLSNAASYVKAGHFRLPNAVSGTKTPVGGGTPVTGWFKEVCEQDGTAYFVQIFT